MEFIDQLNILTASLIKHANPEKKPSMEKYMKNHFVYFGVNSPSRKLAEAELYSQWKPSNLIELKSWVKLLWKQEQREFQYVALEILGKRKKWLSVEDFPFMEDLITTKSWWDTVDMLAGKNLGEILHNNPQIMEQKIHEYTAHENMWINRSAIISQLGFKSDTNVELLEFSILPHTESKEFFIQKAIGWALRQYAKTNPSWVLDFVEKYPLKPLSKREALKHLN